LSWPIVIARRILPIALGFDATVRERDDVVAVLTVRDLAGKYLGRRTRHRRPLAARAREA
jgi:hypothetical protein